MVTESVGPGRESPAIAERGPGARDREPRPPAAPGLCGWCRAQPKLPSMAENHLLVCPESTVWTKANCSSCNRRSLFYCPRCAIVVNPPDSAAFSEVVLPFQVPRSIMICPSTSLECGAKNINSFPMSSSLISYVMTAQINQRAFMPRF